MVSLGFDEFNWQNMAEIKVTQTQKCDFHFLPYFRLHVISS